jgi:hypothetical protein
MLMPDSSNAPPIVTEAPPDQQQATIGEHFSAIITQLQTPEPLDPDTMRDIKAGMMGIQGALQSKVQATQQQQQQPGAAPGTSNETEEFGSGAGAPVEPY